MLRSSLSSLLLGAGILGLVVPVLPAQALQVVVGGVTYDVTAEETTYDADPTRFALIGSGGEMPWWGDSGLAALFAEVVEDQLGPLFPVPGFDEFGPLFAFARVSDPFIGESVDGWSQLIVPPANSQILYQAFPDETLRYAFATRVVVPPNTAAVPGPLPILGVSVCFGYARRLRRRQRQVMGDR
jgi:hypothetical protein